MGNTSVRRRNMSRWARIAMGPHHFVLQQQRLYSRASSASANNVVGGTVRLSAMRIFTIAAVLAFGPANDLTHGFFEFDAEFEQWDHRASF